MLIYFYRSSKVFCGAASHQVLEFTDILNVFLHRMTGTKTFLRNKCREIKDLSRYTSYLTIPLYNRPLLKL